MLMYKKINTYAISNNNKEDALLLRDTYTQ